MNKMSDVVEIESLFSDHEFVVFKGPRAAAVLRIRPPCALPAYLLDVVQGVYWDDGGGDGWYAPAQELRALVKGGAWKVTDRSKSRRPFAPSKLVDAISMFRTYATTPPLARYIFAFQRDFSGGHTLVGQVESFLSMLGHDTPHSILSIRTPSGIIMVTVGGVTFLAAPCLRQAGSSVTLCSSRHWSKALLDRCSAVVFVSDSPEDRWKGVHVIPVQVLIDRGVLSSYMYPGKAYVSFQASTGDLELWTDKYRVCFDDPEGLQRARDVIGII